VLVLEDGRRTGDLSAMTPDHAVAVDPLTISRVEIVRGPMTLLYGSSALGGVINAVRDEVPTSMPARLEGTASVQASSVNSGATTGGELRFPVGGLAMRVEGSGRWGSDLRLPNARLSNTHVETYGAAVGVSRVFDGGYVGASYRGFFNDYGLPGGFVGAHPGGVDITMRRHVANVVGDWHGGDGLFDRVKTSVSTTLYAHDEITASGNVGTSFDQTTVAGDAIANLRAHGPFSNGAIGAQFQYRNVTTGGSLRTPDTRAVSGAVFVVEEASRGPVDLQAGIRADVARYEPLEPSVVVVRGDTTPTAKRSFAAASGSLGILWNAGGGVRVGASVSRSFRIPDINELYSDGPHLASYSYEVGNPRLDQEHGTGLDVFARVERPSWRAEVAAYRNAFSDYIFPRNTGELGRQGERWKFQFSERDAVLTGGEGTVEWTPFGSLVVDATASYVVGRVLGARDTIPGIGEEPDRLSAVHLPLIPPLNGRAGLRWDRTAWFAGAGIRHTADQNKLGDFETRTDGYSLLDASAGVRLFVNGRLHAITIRVENALNEEYRDFLSRTKDVFPESGRNVSLMYRLLF
jgi:iron complex outermembrane receptor protein